MSVAAGVTVGSADAVPTDAITAPRLAAATAEVMASLRVTERITFLLQGGLVLAGSRFADRRARRPGADLGAHPRRGGPGGRYAAGGNLCANPETQRGQHLLCFRQWRSGAAFGTSCSPWPRAPVHTGCLSCPRCPPHRGRRAKPARALTNPEAPPRH